MCKAICHGYEALGYTQQAESFINQFYSKLEKFISLLEQSGHQLPSSLEVLILLLDKKIIFGFL